MHRSIRAILAVTALTLSAASPAADVDVGVSIGISQPGVYGRIDIGRFPQPVLVTPQPVYVIKQPRRVEPVYLWVPPGHQKNWRKHCHRYQACGVPVYFVKDEWYERHVRHSHRRDGYREGYREGRRDERREDRRDDRWDDRRDHRDRDHPGKGHGRDKHRD
jgi:hypothetical protein